MNRQAILQITGGYDVAWVLALVILLCAGLLIYNVLQISLAHDVRQYGLLKILGTTERQLYQIFFRQMARLCLTGGGIGVALGLGLTLGLLPALLKQMYLHQMGEISPTIAFQPWILLGTTGFGIAVCMLSAIFPLRRAVHLPPVESVKLSDLPRRAPARCPAPEKSLFGRRYLWPGAISPVFANGLR